MATTKPLDYSWVPEMVDVLKLVARERLDQVHQYGHNEELPDGTGPRVAWLNHTDVNLDLRSAHEIQRAFRANYEQNDEAGRLSWMLLVREEVAEAFQEDNPERLEAELIQVAALCVSWVETLRRREATS